MKPFKTLGGVALSVSALFLVTSCTKNVDEQFSKGERNATLNVPVGCGNWVNLQTKPNSTGFFFIGQRSDNNWQTFASATNFGSGDYMTLSATGPGNPTPYWQMGNGAIGVASDLPDQDSWRIEAGESLTFELSAGLQLEYDLAGFDLNLHANSNDAGNIKVYNGPSLIYTIPYAGPGFPSQNFNVSLVAQSGTTQYFTKVTIEPTVGRVHVLGPQLNLDGSKGLGLNPTRFNIYSKNPAFMRNTAGPKHMGLTNDYVSIGSTINELPASERQYKRQINNVANSGIYDLNTGFGLSGKTYLNFASTGGSLWFKTSNSRWAIGDEYLTAGEVITITPGANFGKTTFSAFELRIATQGDVGNNLVVKLWSGATQVGGGNTGNIDQSYHLFTGSQDFDRVTIEGTGSPSTSNRISVGRGGLQVLRAWPGCN